MPISYPASCNFMVEQPPTYLESMNSKFENNEINYPKNNNPNKKFQNQKKSQCNLL